MNIVFVSNYMTHHTLPLAQALYERLNGKFTFVETKKPEGGQNAFRRGYAYYLAGADAAERPWVLFGWEQPERARQLILQADAVVTANCSDEWVLARLRRRKLTFRAHERWYRNGLPWYKMPRAVLGAWLHHGRFPSLHLLSASAFTAGDAARVGCFRGKAYRWGYFPAFRAYAPQRLHEGRNGPLPVILWAGRFVDWKRADDALAACGQLWAEGLRFRLRVAGDGPERERLCALAEDVGEAVCFLGQLSPEQLRGEMERSDVFLFTSDFQEGWGAVLNEAMNSGCAVVASHAAGSTPYLIRDGENGLVYPCGDRAALAACIRRLLASPSLRCVLGTRAYETIRAQWSPQKAAEGLIDLCQALASRRPPAEGDGPGSPAPIIKNTWYPKE